MLMTSYINYHISASKVEKKSILMQILSRKKIWVRVWAPIVKSDSITQGNPKQTISITNVVLLNL